MNSRSIVFCSFLVSVLLLSFCPVSVGQTSQQPKRGGTLVVGMPDNPPSMVQFWSTHTTAGLVVRQVFNTLVELAPNTLEVRPGLAESWKISPDGITYTFSLVKNATWHDGKPFTSEDVKFSYTALAKYHGVARVFLGPEIVKSITTPDPYTVVITLQAPWAPFLTALGDLNGTAIYPKHIYDVPEAEFQKNPAAFKPIGTGPFKFVEFVQGQRVVLERNPNYFKKGLPYLDKVIFMIIPDPASRVLALQSGTVNFLSWYVLPPDQISVVKADPKIEVIPFRAAQSAQYIMWFNLRRPLLSNIKVRQGIRYALNLETIMKLAGGEAAVRIGTSPIPGHYTDMHNPAVDKKYTYDLEKANRLLDEAGYPKRGDGTRFSLDFVYDIAQIQHRRTAETLRDQLKEVGINVVLKAMDAVTFIDAGFTRFDMDLTMNTYNQGAHPATGCARLYVSTNVGPGIGRNTAGYINGEVDKLWADAASSTDRKKMLEYYFKVQDIITDDLPGIWLWEYNMVNAGSKEFRDYPASPFGMQDFTYTWWTKAEAKTETAPTGISTTTVGLIAAVVILAGVAGYFAYRKRAQKPAST